MPSRTSLSSYGSINNDANSLNNYSFDVNFHSDLAYLNLFNKCNGIYYFFYMSYNNNFSLKRIDLYIYMYIHIYLSGENDVEYAELSQLQSTDANSNPVPVAGFPKPQGKKDNRWQSKNPTNSASANQMGLSNEVLFLSVFNKNGWICPMQLPPKGIQ